jgi:hypothetical protein
MYLMLLMNRELIQPREERICVFPTKSEIASPSD